MAEVVLGKSKVREKHQVTIIKAVLPFLKVKQGDVIEYMLIDGKIVIRKSENSCNKTEKKEVKNHV